MGENHFAPLPSALYGLVLFMAAIAYVILQQCIIVSEGPHSVLRRAIGRDWKGKLSPIVYLVAMIASLRSSLLAQVGYVLIALVWLVPDRRIEHALRDHGTSHSS
jgi:uncharacterized membrane protein